MLKIQGDNSHFWQWDTGRRLIVDEPTCTKVYFYNTTTEKALAVDVKYVEGVRVAAVPDLFLQSAFPLTAYVVLCDEDKVVTHFALTFPVYPRPKPFGYISTDDEILTWTSLDLRIKTLEEGVTDVVKTVNGVAPDASGNVEITIPDSSPGASGGSGIWYGTTSTGENTAEKVVTTVTGDFKLVKGARLGVKFLTNTVNCNSLIVDGTARTYIRSSNDEAGNADSSAPIVWHNLGQVQWFTYDGEYFILDDSIRATAANSLCGKVAVSDSVSSTGNTVASSTAVKTAYDKAAEALDAVSDLDTAIATAIGSGVVS